ncbi:hypothetical protein Acr_00g0072940 [Actinidia rufa]|uniref:Integrase catalytic domain-containing protein n=1 Tax=Actinidia rufa TaxID=165716 RepID=A0A7J0DS43_9ERIC|nr:hypothetical protein Acr_00g0072940 [Actinidia rufa]
MQRFLRARKLWKYITGDAQPPHFSETDDDDDTLLIQYQTHLEDWDSVNSKIITWFSNTSVSSIHSLFTPFETAKEVWDYLAKRYSSVDGSNEYQLGLELHHLRFDSGRTLTDFYNKMSNLWNHLAQFEPTWTCPTDAAAFYAYRDRSRLRHFLMALPPDYEHIRASLLHRHPLPTVGQALAELRSEETRKKTMVYQHSQPVLATPVWAPLQPSSQSVRGSSSKNMPFGSPKQYCSFCRRDTHSYEDCRSRSKPKRKGYHNRQTAAVTNSFGPSPDSPSSTLTTADVETIVTQVLSGTNLHSSALSTTSGTLPWLFDTACCNHMTSDTSLFSVTHPTTSVHPIHTADGSLMTTTHTGTIRTPALTINHAYLVPALSHNLLFVGQLCELGFYLHFSNSGCLVQDPRTGKTIGTGRKVGRLFELESLHAPHWSVAAASSSSSPISFDLWHSRLGHVSMTTLQKLISRGYLGSVKTESTFHCLACQTGKQHALTFSISDSLAKAPFDLVHSDEYKQTEFLNILKQNGTLPHSSCPGTSQQNGRAERKLRHILDTGRALLISASVTESFWGEAALTAVYTINRTPIEHKGYRCYDPISKRLRISRHVEFWKNVKFSEISKTPPPSGLGRPLFTYPSLDIILPVTSPSPAGSPPSPSLPSRIMAVPDVSPPAAPPSVPCPPVRSSTRVRTAPSHLRDYHCYFALSTLHEPRNFREASSNPKMDPRGCSCGRSLPQSLENTPVLK